MAFKDRGLTYKKTKDGGGFKDLVLKAQPTAQREVPSECSAEQANEPSEDAPGDWEIEF